MPKVSVIIPVYNTEKYLRKCLDSVCNQSLKDIEIICVNDCSTDRSREILNDYKSRYSNLKVIDCKENGGESKARNIGLENATGEYLAFVDNDDSLDLDFYEKLYNQAKKGNADICRGRVHIIGYDGKESYDDLNEKIKQKQSKLLFAFYWWTAIYKRSLIENNNLKFLEGYSLGGDVLFLNEAILAANKLELVDNTFYNYYRREDSGDSRVLTTEKVKSVLEIHEKILNNVLDNDDISSDIEGIHFICNWCLRGAIDYVFRNKTKDCLQFCANKACHFYKKIKMNTDNFEFNLYPLILNFLENNSPDELVEFYNKNDTQKKMFLANLRFMHNLKRGLE